MELFKKIFVGVLAAVFALSMILALKLTLVDGIERQERPVTENTRTDNKVAVTGTDTSTAAVAPKGDYKDIPVEDIDDTGFLVLVNHSNPTGEISESRLKMTSNGLHYVRDDMYDHLVEFMDYMDSEGYPILINSSYRSKKEQQELYDTSETKNWTAEPGKSEHHTGLAVDLIAIAELDSDDDKANRTYEIMRDYCMEYGFVLRYPEGKEALTEIDYEYWHFRYVGQPHAAYMTEHGLVLEEYIDLLHREKVDITYGDATYLVYAVKEKDGKISVPATNSYAVSSDNTGYYIVTEKKSGN